MPGSQDAGGLDEDDGNNFCVPGTDSTLVMINGCFFDDEDWDGQSYRLDWPGTNPNPFIDRQLHPTPVRFTSATTRNGTVDYSTIAFETDLPALETEDAQFNPPFCDRTTGANCVNPPNGAQFYPFFTTFGSGGHDNSHGGGGCLWQEGGNFIPGTTNHFGGSSTTEYGPLLRVVFPEPGFTTTTRSRTSTAETCAIHVPSRSEDDTDVTPRGRRSGAAPMGTRVPGCAAPARPPCGR